MTSLTRRLGSGPPAHPASSVAGMDITGIRFVSDQSPELRAKCDSRRSRVTAQHTYPYHTEAGASLLDGSTPGTRSPPTVPHPAGGMTMPATAAVGFPPP